MKDKKESNVSRTLAILEGNRSAELERLVNILTDALGEDVGSVAQAISIGTAVLNAVPRVKDLAKHDEDDASLAKKIYAAILHSEMAGDKKLRTAMERLNQKYGMKRNIDADIKGAAERLSAHNKDLKPFHNQQQARDAFGSDHRANRSN